MFVVGRGRLAAVVSRLRFSSLAMGLLAPSAATGRREDGIPRTERRQNARPGAAEV